MTTHVGRTYYRFSEDFYNRIHIVPETLDLSLLIAEESHEVFIWNAYAVSKTINSITPSGSNILVLDQEFNPITFPVVLGPYEHLTVVVGILVSEGPVGGGLDIDIAGETPISYPISGELAYFLPFQPISFKQVFEWRTQVLTSYNGSEQRIKLRNAPRIGVEMSVPVSFDEIPLAKNLLDGFKNKTWIVPFWNNSEHVDEIIPGNQYSLFNGLEPKEQGDFAIMWESTSHYEIVRLNSSYLAESLNSYSDAQIIPTRLARMPDSTVRDIDGHSALIKVKYTVQDVRIGSTPITILPAFFDGDTSSTDTIASRSEVVDFETGAFDFVFPWTYNKVSRNIKVKMYTPEQLSSFLNFIYARFGKAVPFTMPSYEYDLIRTDVNPGGNNIQVRDNSYSDAGLKYSKIAIQKGVDGVFSFHDITDVEEVSYNVVNLILSPGLISESDQSDIMRICYALTMRLDTDSIELNWVGNGVVESSFNIIEAL